MTFWLLLSISYAQTLLIDQIPTSPLDTMTIRTFQGLASKSELRRHVYFLASDPMSGREAGTIYEKIAAAYLIAQHRCFGNEPFLAQGYVHAFALAPKRRDVEPPKRARKASPAIVDTPYAWNVLACRRGKSLPDEYVILSAHYDHIGTTSKGEPYNGADDNGSGTAVLLEVARLLSLLPPPKRTIVFFHTAAEEKGLLGAMRFVRDSLIRLASIVAVLNADMLGRTDTLHQVGDLYLYAIGSERASPKLKALQETVNTLCCGWQFDYRYDDPKDPQRLFYRSDHYAFAKHGVPAVFYFGGLHDDYHQVSDDAEKIDFDRLHRASILIASLAWSLANL
ncbi:MAG: M28 family peptidase [Bacteroidia bacterium]|nr:M28 family peptidase [Bacteroidia bacterium]MCX7651408.1 M28 family peptidase [Bacteroidia bacterium]MDW8417043.1 M28 family peptidase [Bacteroidia bacterium]